MQKRRAIDRGSKFIAGKNSGRGREGFFAEVNLLMTKNSGRDLEYFGGNA